MNKLNSPSRNQDQTKIEPRLNQDRTNMPTYECKLNTYNTIKKQENQRENHNEILELELENYGAQ